MENNAATLLKIAVGAAAGAGLTYGVFNLPSHRDLTVSDQYFLARQGDSNDLLIGKWTASKLQKKYETAIERSRELVRRFKSETGAPGIVVGVSVDGITVWKEGFGYSDIENGAPCHIGTSMRIASISKPLTIALLAKMWEDGKIDLDKPIQEYVKNFPIKNINGENVDITSRQLASHTGGIRHYTKKGEKSGRSDSSSTEFYIKERYMDVEKSLDLFKNDELLFKPGTSFEYTTHGYTLLSAVMEGVGQKPFKKMMEEFFKLFQMENTHLDEINPIIYNRSSYYAKNAKGRLINAELADTSYKWAGGGVISTVSDLLKFSNAMLYCFQQCEKDRPGYLKQSTLQELWTPVKHSSMSWGKDSGYGLGWVVVPFRSDIGGLDVQPFYIGHGGGAVGASSVLLILPRKTPHESEPRHIPKGVCVAILINLQDVSCHKLGKKIADEFS